MERELHELEKYQMTLKEIVDDLTDNYYNRLNPAEQQILYNCQLHDCHEEHRDKLLELADIFLNYGREQ